MLIFGGLSPTEGHCGSIVCAEWHIQRTLDTKRDGPLYVCVLCLLVWAIKKNLESVIMVVGKAGREGALILQVDGDFFPLVQLPLGEHHAPDPEVSSAFKLEASSLMAL